MQSSNVRRAGEGPMTSSEVGWGMILYGPFFEQKSVGTNWHWHHDIPSMPMHACTILISLGLKPVEFYTVKMMFQNDCFGFCLCTVISKTTVLALLLALFRACPGWNRTKLVEEQQVFGVARLWEVGNYFWRAALWFCHRQYGCNTRVSDAKLKAVSNHKCNSLTACLESFATFASFWVLR